MDELFGGSLKAQVIENAEAGSRLVVRPDSGDPVTTPIEVIEHLIAKFGCTENSKGYRVLPDYVRVLQGDGITPDTIKVILDAMKSRGLSAENIVFGMGSGLLQQVDRDTQKFAMKCSAVEVAGKWRDVFKDPVTDAGKRSKRGILDLVETADGYKTVRRHGQSDGSEMQTVYRDGQILITDSLEAVRHRAENRPTFAKVA